MTDPHVRPLEGVRVLELAHLIAGPTGGMYLADMGADVIKVESREAPDASRSVYGVARGGGGHPPSHREPQQARALSRSPEASRPRGLLSRGQDRRRRPRRLSQRRGG